MESNLNHDAREGRLRGIGSPSKSEKGNGKLPELGVTMEDDGAKSACEIACDVIFDITASLRAELARVVVELIEWV